MNATDSVMIVDDDEDIREIGTLVLESYGYRVSAAKDGLDALEMLERSDSPCVILLDLMMPRMDGEQFLKALRASDKAHIPVALMSGHSEASKIASELSADSLLRKPFDLDILLKTVRELIAHRPLSRRR
jgi:chemosensory pili system protein ChpA (sensor histidine kinase/response regulator)